MHKGMVGENLRDEEKGGMEEETTESGFGIDASGNGCGGDDDGGGGEWGERG